MVLKTQYLLNNNRICEVLINKNIHFIVTKTKLNKPILVHYRINPDSNTTSLSLKSVTTTLI